MFEYFYNEVFRSVIIGFGSLFNGIEIQHKDESDNTFSTIQVPLAYGPTQKFLARMQQEADLNRPVQMTLPRMSFEFTGLSYDPSRKTTKTQSFVTTGEDGTQFKKVYSPVPYNMTIVLSIYTKLNDDMLQIVEQILPFFQPSYNLPIKFLGGLNEIKDVAINLDSIGMDDDYEGNFDTRRALIIPCHSQLRPICMVLSLMLVVMLLRKLLLDIWLDKKVKELLLETWHIRSHQELPKIMMEV